MVAAIAFGAGFGMMNPALQTMALRLAPAERRGAASSTYLCFFNTGFALGGILGGILAERWGYAAMFSALIVTVVVSLLLYHFWARHSPAAFKNYMAAQQAKS